MTADPHVPTRATVEATATLLWQASHPCLDPDAVAAAVDDGADVVRAARTALEQHVGPLLWRALVAVGRTDGLGAAGDRLRTEHDVRRGQAALLIPRAVAAAVRPLTAAGLEPLVLKGPVLAARYPAPGLRPMDDLDVLLPPDQYATALAVLEGAGWEVWSGRSKDAHYDTVLFNRDVPHMPLELHQGLEVWRDRATGLRADALWRARVPVDCLGTPAFGLRPEDELVSLAVHAGKPFHQFNRLIWSVDLAVVVQAAGAALDWDEVARRARQVGASTVVAVGLCHARRLGASVPDALLALPPGRVRREALAPVLDVTWPVIDADVGIRHRLRYALADHRRRQLLLAAAEITEVGVLAVPGQAVRLAFQGVRRLATPSPGRLGPVTDEGRDPSPSNKFDP